MRKQVYRPQVDPSTFEESCSELSDNERMPFTLKETRHRHNDVFSLERDEDDSQSGFENNNDNDDDSSDEQDNYAKKRVTFYSDAILKSNGASNSDDDDNTSYESSLHPLLRKRTNNSRSRSNASNNSLGKRKANGPSTMKRKSKNLRLDTTMGAGRLETGRVTFDEIHDEFRTTDPNELQRQHKTPYASIVTPEEVDTMRDWAIRKTESKNRLRNDKMYDFITMVAAFMNREPTRLLKTPTGIKRPPPGGMPGTGVPGRTTRRTLAPPTGDPGGPILGPAVVAQTPPSPLPIYTPIERTEEGVLWSPVGSPRIRSPQDRPPPPPPRLLGAAGEEEEGLIFPLRAAGFRNEQQELRAREAENAQRMFSLTYWLESPEVIGMMDISADVYGHAKLAFAQIKMRIPHFRNVDNLHRLIDTDEDIIRTYYAQLTAMASSMNSFFNPSRTPLDRNEHRIRKHISMLINSLSRFRWDPKKNDFTQHNQYEDHWEQGDGLVIRGRGSSYNSGVEPPTYMLGDLRRI